MLKTIHTKILLAILAAVLAIGGYIVHVHDENVRAIEAIKKHDAETWEAVRTQRLKNNSNNVNGSKTWTTYIP